MIPRHLPRLPRLLVALLALTAFSRSAVGLTVVEADFGVANRAISGAFNPVTIRLANPTAAPFEGVLTLSRGTAMARTGAPQQRQVYLAPRTERIVRFHAYVFSSGENWQLTWREGNEQHGYPFANVKTGAPIRVELIDDGGIQRPRTRLHRLLDGMFPTTAAATSGLAGVVISRPPMLTPAQRLALVDYVRGGGEVYLLPQPDGALPLLVGELSPLAHRQTARVGNGRVVVLPHDESGQPLDTRALVALAGPPPSTGDHLGYENQACKQALPLMRGMIAPDHAWAVIYLLALAYLLLITVGNAIVGRRWRTYWPATAFFFGVVALFGLLFVLVGRRGYGEEQTIHQVALIRPLGDGRANVEAWGNLFVTKSGTYEIAHDTPQPLYDAGEDEQKVDGVIYKATYTARIPLYASRQFLFAGVVEDVPPLRLSVDQWRRQPTRARNTLGPLTLRLLCDDQAWPQGFVDAYARVGGDPLLYRLRLSTTTVDGQPRRVLEQRGNGAPPDQIISLWEMGPGWGEEEPGGLEDERTLRKLGRMMVAHALGDHDHLPSKTSGMTPTDAVDVFVIARLPEAIARQRGTASGARGTGRAVYHVRLWRDLR